LDGDVPILHGRDISPYNIDFQNRFFTYDKQDIVGGCSKREVYESDEKLLIQAIRNIKLKKRIISAYDNSKHYVIGGLLSVTTKVQNINLKYLLAILNSKLINFYFQTISIDKNIKVVFLKQLPIKLVTQEKENEIVELVEKILTLKKQLHSFGNKLTDEKAITEQNIDEIINILDEKIYKIYNLNNEDIEIIEEYFVK
jgi:hypothetical protein